MVRILGVAMVLAGLTFGAATAATADPIRVDGSLFSVESVCAGTSAVAVVPGSFDGERPVRLSAGAWSVDALAGSVVSVPVGTVPVEVKAAGFRDGLPHEVIDQVAVEERCGN